jgi:hypothetical protein
MSRLARPQPGLAGVVLADPRGELRVAAAFSEEAGLPGLFQLQNDQGPCPDCFRTGRAVTAITVQRQDRHAWPTHVTEGHGLTAHPASRPT